ncbi:MAG: 4'-phosphopantetheinyl transferase superfamily protein, partial [Saprospiraceae bacterium]|nr:4'-phosphopantetheinyl transferase superfamily protein [Saprospiraceae bacterium]
NKLKGRKRLEYMSARHLVHLLTGLDHRMPIHTDLAGKPVFLWDPTNHLSISHSHQFAAAILSKTSKVGIDIQLIVPQMQKVAKRVFSLTELSFASTENELEMLHILWGIKEAVYKAFGLGGIDFKNQISVHPFSYQFPKGSFKADLIKENQTISYNGTYQFSPEGYVSVYLNEEG